MLAATEDAKLHAGFAKVDVTPPLAIPYLSYYPRQTPFEGVHDHLFARAFAAEVVAPESGPAGVGASGAGDGVSARERVALVAVDSLGFSRSILGPERDFIAEVRERIERRTGIPAANVLIAATHAHSTPQTTDLFPLVEQFPGAAEWLDRLMEQITGAVALAWARRRPAAMRGMTGLAPGIAWCRRIITKDGRIVRLQARPPDDQVIKEPRDDRVPALLVSNATTDAGHSAHWRGALFGFTCHPTTVQVQPLVSADFPGVACDLVERELQAEACLFLQGACGNVGPVRATTDFQDATLYGRSLGGEALRLLSLLEARDLAPMPAVIAAGSERVELERRPLPDRAALAPEAEALERTIAGAVDGDARRTAIAAYRRVVEPLRLAELGTGPVKVELQAIRLGDALIVACEGELFVEYGNRIKDASEAAVTFVAAYSNGYEGYIPTPETWDEGGYEPSVGPWTRIWRSGGEVLTERALALTRRVWHEGEQQK